MLSTRDPDITLDSLLNTRAATNVIFSIWIFDKQILNYWVKL